jgi:hypothetical protein
MAINDLKMPVANQAAADRASTASRARMQSNLAMSSGQAMMSGPAVAQKAAGAQAQEQAQIVAQAGQAQVQQTAGQAQAELAQAALRQREQNAINSEEMAKRHDSQRAKLASFGRDVEQELLTKQLSFDKTQREDRFADQRQLADFVRMEAADEQSLRNYTQAVEAAIDKDITMLESAYKTLVQAEYGEFADREQTLDEESMARIKNAKKKIKADLDKAKKKAKTTKGWMAAIKIGAGAALIATGVGVGAGTSLAVSGAVDVATNK